MTNRRTRGLIAICILLASAARPAISQQEQTQGLPSLTENGKAVTQESPPPTEVGKILDLAVQYYYGNECHRTTKKLPVGRFSPPNKVTRRDRPSSG